MKKAFTLIELLVVIAIIAILAAILFPVFAQAKEAAKKAACLSNVKQQATAVKIYLADYDDTNPQSVYDMQSAQFTPGTGHSAFSIYDAILPYTKNKQIFQCPDNQQAIRWQDMLALVGMVSPNQLVYSSYAPNFSLFADPAIANYAPLNLNISTVSDTSLPEPAGTTMFYDARYIGFGPTASLSGGVTTNPDATGNPLYAATATPFGIANFPGTIRHAKGLNVNFADGHAKFVKGNTDVPGTSPDLYYGIPGQVQTYHFPYDMNGIPDIVDDPIP